jgi:glycosyltransferase involved in cell wall biosynthesis
MPNGVDLERFANLPVDAREQSRRALRISEHEFVVGTVGSLTPVKRHNLLIQAAARAATAIPHLRLVIVGDGPLRTELEQLARSEGLAERVILTGPREDVPGLLKAMDVYVCSSDSEGMSNALLEAMAAGLPIVATDVGDNARLLDDGKSGLIVPPGSSATLADAMAVMRKTPNLRQKLRCAVLSQIGQYGLQRRLALYVELYGRLSSLRHEPHVLLHDNLEKSLKNQGYPY